MISCLIVDDEPLAVQLLEDYIDQIESLTLIHKCYNALEALSFLKTNPVDVIFLDINMPKLSGLELTSLLPPNQKIVFTTAYSEHAVASYEKNSIDYLLKPITFERFMKTVIKLETVAENKTLETINTINSLDTNAVFIKSGKAIIKVDFGEILFVEGLKDYVSFNTISKKIIAHKKMKELEETLPDYFIRVHNSYIINKNHMVKFEDNQVYIGNQKIAVSEKYRELFLQKINLSLL